MLPFLLISAAGCNHYELFQRAGYAQESFSNDADILFVIDNSSSMTDEAAALALNFDVFIKQLTDPTEAGEQGGLEDAAGGYIQYVQNRGRFVDYQLAITTTSVEDSFGDLYGYPSLLAKGEAGIEDQFAENLLCDATCWSTSQMADVPGDYSCGDDLGEEVHQAYLDCVCGEARWKDNCGAGTEEGLEAVLMAMCRSVENPPAACYEQNQFDETNEMSNEGLLREDSTLITVIVTDEGDNSRRMAQGQADPSEAYGNVFDQFGHRMAFAVIGPTTDDCNGGGATTWGVERYQYFVSETDGRWFDIADSTDASCPVSDFSGALEELGQLLNSLLDVFPLQSVPDVETILVFVDGEAVERAAETVSEDDAAESTWSSGWSYLAAENAIEFHGDAVPDYNAEVQIFYRPLDGMPRDLPFE